MTKVTIPAAQGEVGVIKIKALPSDIQTKAVERNNNGDCIISHSEQGNHHVLAGGVEVLERTNNVPVGMRILYAILNEPTQLVQDAAVPHEAVNLDPGIYEFRTAREYDPFSQQARRVAD